MRSQLDRRVRRSHDTTTALRFQLESCRAEGRLDAMVIADETGTCLAYAGSDDTCGEIAARAPLLGRKTWRFRGVLLSAAGHLAVVMRRFELDGHPFFICAAGASDERSEILAA